MKNRFIKKSNGKVIFVKKNKNRDVVEKWQLSQLADNSWKACIFKRKKIFDFPYTYVLLVKDKDKQFQSLDDAKETFRTIKTNKKLEEVIK